jgi:hypothetical protein
MWAMSSIRRGVVVAVAVALVVGLAACSSSKHAPSAGGTQPHLEKKASEAASALLAGKYQDGYQYLDADCQKRWTRQTWATNSAAGVAGLKSLGIDLSQDHLGTVTITDFTPTSATVTTHIVDKSGQDVLSGTAATAKSEVWLHQDGRWVNSDCAAAAHISPGATNGLVPASTSTTA